jgi:hypothetical protein
MEELSKKDGISLEYFVSIAVAEKISSWVTDGFIQDRAKRANKEKYLQVLKLVPDREPLEHDKLQ